MREAEVQQARERREADGRRDAVPVEREVREARVAREGGGDGAEGGDAVAPEVGAPQVGGAGRRDGEQLGQQVVCAAAFAR